MLLRIKKIILNEILDIVLVKNNKFNIANNIISSDVNCDDRNNENKYNIKCERMTEYNIGNVEN